MHSSASEHRLTRQGRKQSLAPESCVGVMHCSDFRVDNYRLDMRGKHTPSDDPGLACGACGPEDPFAKRPVMSDPEGLPEAFDPDLPLSRVDRT